MEEFRKFLMPLFYITALYSFIMIPSYAVELENTNNPSTGFVVFAIYLFICFLLLFLSIQYHTKFMGAMAGIVVFSIWSFMTTNVCSGDLIKGLVSFLPFLIVNLLAIVNAFWENKVPVPIKESTKRHER